MDKGYYPNWTDEIFEVTNTSRGAQRPMYRIEAGDGTKIPQRMYTEDLQKVKPNYYRIEKIIRRDTQNGVRGFIVKWLNYPSKYNSFVPESEIINFNANRRNT